MNGRLTMLSMIAACGLLIAACSGDGDDGGSGARSPIDLAGVTLSEPVAFAVEGAVVAPPGESQGRWIEVFDGQICVTTVVESEAARDCAAWEASLDLQSFAWTPDGTTLYFTPNFRRFLEESDVWALQPATGRLDNLTDDGTDEPFEDRAVTDIAPFVTEAGRLHFFTLGRDPSDVELTMLDEDGDPRPLPSVSLVGASPEREIHPIGGDRFLYQGFSGQDRPLVLLDLAAGEASEIRVPQFEESLVLASAPGAAVVADFDALARRGELIVEVLDFDRGEPGEIDRQVLDLPIEEFSSPTFGFSPDGSTLIVAFRGPDETRWQLAGLQRSDNGDFGEPVTIAEAGFLGQDQEGRDRVLIPKEAFSQILWTDDDQLLVPSDDAVLVFDLIDSTG